MTDAKIRIVPVEITGTKFRYGDEEFETMEKVSRSTWAILVDFEGATMSGLAPSREQAVTIAGQLALQNGWEITFVAPDPDEVEAKPEGEKGPQLIGIQATAVTVIGHKIDDGTRKRDVACAPYDAFSIDVIADGFTHHSHLVLDQATAEQHVRQMRQSARAIPGVTDYIGPDPAPR